MNKNIIILYVEDDEYIRENTKRPLSYLCDKLIIAKDGKEGLELYNKYNPDLVVADIKMPHMTGIEMCRAIKEVNPNQHFIFTTAHNEDSYFIEAIEMQVDGYILKPIDYDLLENKIENILEQINLKAENILQKEKIIQQNIDILEQSKNVQMGELISNIAHQWRQPLNAITTALSAIQIKKNLNDITEEEETELLNMIDENSHFLSETIDIFRNYIIEKKEKKNIILQDRINTTLSILESSLNNHNIKFIKDFEGSEPINIDIIIGELDQVIINIINNSKDNFIKNCINNGYIKLSLLNINNKVIISIEDNAGGIPVNILPKIFDPYFTTKHKSQGTGLGLYISKNIIEKSFFGKLSAKTVGNKTIIDIELPLNIKS